MYVQKHFKEEAKAAMDEMVRDIRHEFDRILDEIDWMDSKTKRQAKVYWLLIFLFQEYS